MKSKIISIILLIITVISILLFINNKTVYVTGKYSKYCYILGDHNHNIKVAYYYSSLTECNKPLK